MKKITPILLFITSFSFAQDFAPTGAKWHFQNFSWGGSGSSYHTIEANRDTTINGNFCTILEKDTGLIIPAAQLIIWEGNNKVYFFENNQFKLLFDFNLNAGDTLTYHIPVNYIHYNLICGVTNPDSSKTDRAIVDSTQNLIINSQTLKTLYTSPLSHNDTNYLQCDLGQITERIGSTSGFLGHSLMQCLGGSPSHFRCYSDNLINYKPVSEECDYATSINSYEINGSLSIFPNPTSSNFTINEIDNPYDLLIYNTVGQVIYKENDVATTNNVIDVAQFARGVLFVRIESEGKAFYQKVVKQ